MAKSSPHLVLTIFNLFARRSTENLPIPFSPNLRRPFGEKGSCTLLSVPTIIHLVVTSSKDIPSPSSAIFKIDTPDDNRF